MRTEADACRHKTHTHRKHAQRHSGARTEAQRHKGRRTHTEAQETCAHARTHTCIHREVDALACALRLAH
eukprot:14091338-Alexandrium_andersonii.AAC.1